MGPTLEIYLMPYPLELAAIDNVLEVVKSPPPVNPPVVLTAVAVPTAERLVLASAAVLAPVPPSATAKSVMPVIDPPVIATELAF